MFSVYHPCWLVTTPWCRVARTRPVWAAFDPFPRIHENRKEMNTRYITEIVHTTPLLNPLFLPNLHTHAKRPLTFSATSNGVEAQAARDRDRASFVVAPQRHGRAPVTVNRAAE